MPKSTRELLEQYVDDFPILRQTDARATLREMVFAIQHDTDMPATLAPRSYRTMAYALLGIAVAAHLDARNETSIAVLFDVLEGIVGAHE